MKKKKKNNKGFTLIELLAVIVILVALVSLALPSISSTLERSKDKIRNQKIELLGALADQYLTEEEDIKAYNCFKEDKCDSIEIKGETDNDADKVTFYGELNLKYMKARDYIDDDDLVDGDGKCLYDDSIESDCENACISYNKDNKEYKVEACS